MNELLIKIRAIFEGRGAEQATAQIQNVSKAAESATTKTGLFSSGLRGCVASASVLGNVAGTVLTTGITAAVGAIVGMIGAMRAFIGEGVRFNSTLENAQLGMAAVFKQFDKTGQFADFDAAMKASANAIEMLKAKAVESPASFQQLVQAYQATAGAMAASGMTMKQQVDTIVLMSQTLSGLGIRSEQIIQESRALLTGNITEDAAAARILGITRNMIETAKAEGRLYEFIQGRMASFAEAGKRSAMTLTTSLSNLGDITQQLSGHMAKPIFEIFKGAVRDTTQVVQTLARWTGAIKDTGKELETTAEAVKTLQINAKAMEEMSLQKAREQANQLADAYARAATQIERTAQAQRAMLDIEEQIALAELDGKNLNPVDRARAQQQIQESFRIKRREAEDKADVDTIKNAQRMKEQAGGQVQRAEAGMAPIAGRLAEVERAEAEAARLAQQIQSLRNERAKAEEVIGTTTKLDPYEIAKRLAEMGANLVPMGQTASSLIGAARIGDQVEKAQAVSTSVQTISLLDEQIKKLEEKQKSALTASMDGEAVRAELNAAKSAYEEAKKAYEQITTNADKTISEANFKRQLRQDLAPKEERLADIKGGQQITEAEQAEADARQKAADKIRDDQALRDREAKEAADREARSKQEAAQRAQADVNIQASGLAATSRTTIAGARGGSSQQIADLKRRADQTAAALEDGATLEELNAAAEALDALADALQRRDRESAATLAKVVQKLDQLSSQVANQPRQ